MRHAAPLVLLLALGCAGTHAAADAHARAALAQGETGAAEQHLGEELLRPDAPSREARLELLRLRAHALALLGKPEERIPVLEEALALAPEDPWLHYALGVALVETGDTAQACASFGRAVALDPLHVKALQWRAEAHLTRNEYAAAASDLTLALEALAALGADRVAAWGTADDAASLARALLARRATALHAVGEHARAEEDLARARAL